MRISLVEGLENRDFLSATLLVPMYFAPDENTGWARITTSVKKVAITAILNPDSGPSTPAQAAIYKPAVDKFRKAGGKVVAYVYTRVGSSANPNQLRPIAEVKADILKYPRLYNVDGFFVDEMGTTPAEVGYYRNLYAYIKKLGTRYQVIGNPGTNIDKTYLASPPAADVVIDFESNQADYASWSPGPGRNTFSATHYGQIFGQANVATMQKDVVLAVRNHNQYIFCTDQNINDDSSAYSKLPSYWDQEVLAVSKT